MAIKKNWIKRVAGFDTTASKTDAYIKVMSVSANKHVANASIVVYESEPTEDLPTRIIDEASYSFTPSVSEGSTNFIAQAYKYLKTLPEFENAVDC